MEGGAREHLFPRYGSELFCRVRCICGYCPRTGERTGGAIAAGGDLPFDTARHRARSRSGGAAVTIAQHSE
jgi:hypothetical protein